MLFFPVGAEFWILLTTSEMSAQVQFWLLNAKYAQATLKHYIREAKSFQDNTGDLDTAWNGRG